MGERIDLSGSSRYPVGVMYTRHILTVIPTTLNREVIIGQIRTNKALGNISEKAADVLLELCEPVSRGGDQKKCVLIEI